MIIKTLSLTPLVSKIICEKATESPFSGEYCNNDDPGSYLCRQCGLALFRSSHKFSSYCGWPSFDEEIPGAVSQLPDFDGQRTEIVCTRCHAHLGHVFTGEGFTLKNTRHCVNSLSLDFVQNLTVEDTEEAIVAGGCFWGIEYYLQKLPGVVKTEVGYIGGSKDFPTYQEVCANNTGHLEATRIVYDIKKLDYQTLIKRFFEIHDPTQNNGQGPDIGEQYRSAIFYYDDNQKTIAEKLIIELKQQSYNVATQLLPISIFWPAEKYHQNYYGKDSKTPYCHQ